MSLTLGYEDTLVVDEPEGVWWLYNLERSAIPAC